MADQDWQPHIALTEEAIDVTAAFGEAAAPGCGAVSTFVGTVRNRTADRPVVQLEYEAYAPMAIREMGKIVAEARTRWPLQRAVVVHRVGTLRIGEAAVVVAVATPHRHDAFAACQFIIDTLKQTVPIWKKEIFADGEVWVAAHP